MITTNINTNKENGVDDLISKYLDAHDILYVDHRKNGGYIFVAGESTLSKELKQLKKVGVHFHSSKNSSVLHGQWAWVTLQKLFDCPREILDMEEDDSIKNQGGKKVIELSSLTNEQIQYICERIPKTVIVDYFNSNSKEYNKIWKGRAQSLKRERIVWLLVTNINNPYIASFVEKCISIWFTEIEEFRKSLEENGATRDESLIRALPDSVFNDNIDLYFLLCGDVYPKEYIALIKNILPLIPNSMESNDFQDESDETVEEKAEIDSLKNQLDEVQTQITCLQTQLLSEQSLREQREGELTASLEKQAELQNSLTILKRSEEHTSELQSRI